MVRFKRLNLIEPFPFEDAFDVILCRNVMIYFDERTQEALANKLYDVLLDGGYLFIGHSETFTRISHRFKYIKPSVYQKL
jgi:chemotaxis protein methyltransferase CheR